MDHYMIRQELNPETCRLDTKQCRYVYTGPAGVSSVATDPPGTPVAPCIEIRIRKGEDKGRKREKFYIYLDVTHTHTRPEPGQPWKARGRKKRTHDGQTAKNSAGGEGNRRTSGTNLHGETDLTTTAHTPKPHNTLRRGTQGKIRDQMGN